MGAAGKELALIGPRAAAMGGGRPLPDDVRTGLERAFGTSLAAVRIHTSPAADLMARALRADAFTCGSAVFFRDGAYHPDTRAGQWLLAHEIAHVVLHGHDSTGHAGWALSKPGDRHEAEADRFAARVLRGEPALPPGDRRPVAAAPSQLVLRHVSYEHRILGDGSTDDLVAASLRNERGKLFLATQINMLNLWALKPPREVTRQDVEKISPGTRTFYLGPDRLLVTYGELNALPDFLPDAQSFDQLRADTLVPILQTIRQEGYNALDKLINNPLLPKQFPEALVAPFWPSFAYDVIEIEHFDRFTFGQGTDGKDHYGGILARNACHFAPHCWYRWQKFHELGRLFASQAYQTKKEKDYQLAWTCHGYADHFLQDSFAAGHLVNRTLVMQWFVEWATRQRADWITDLDVLQEMSASLQPFLAGHWLYKSGFPERANDPQTTQEAGSIVARFLSSTLARKRGTSDLDVYQNYLTFVTSAAANLAANDLHNEYNQKSLWVTSVARPAPYRVWGDFTLLSRTDGAMGMRATSEAAQLSQRALKEIIDTGSTAISMDQIRAHFPTGAGETDKTVRSLRDWATGNRSFCEQVFNQWTPQGKKRLVELGSPRLGIVSTDQRLARIWQRQITSSFTGNPQVLAWNGRVFAGVGGWVAEFNVGTGAITRLRKPPSFDIPGDYTTRLATDGRNLYIGVHGYVYAAPLHDIEQDAWPRCPVGGIGIYSMVNVLVTGGRVYAGSAGHVYQIDPLTGKSKDHLVAPSTTSAEVRLATDGTRLYAGLPHAVGAVTLSTWTKAWDPWSTGNTDPRACTDVLASGGRLYAGTGGKAFELDTATGRLMRPLTLTNIVSFGDVNTRLAADGQRLYVGYNGYAYAVRLAGWTKAWEFRAADDEGFQRVELVTAGTRLYVGAQGIIYDITPETGKARTNDRLTVPSLTGADYPTTLSRDGRFLYAGVHGWAYKLLVQEPWLAGTVSRIWWEGRWGGWEYGFDGAPPMDEVLVTAANNIEAFGIGDGGTVYHDWRDPSRMRWNGWEPNFRQAPPMRSLTAVTGAILCVMGIGRDGVLYWNTFEGGQWRPTWTPDPELTSVRQVSGISWSRAMFFFAVTTTGELRYKVYNNASKTWTRWVWDIEPPWRLNAAYPMVGATNHLELFGIGTNNALSHTWCQDGDRWGVWNEPFDGAKPMQSVSSATGPDNHLEVFGIGLDGTVYHDWFDGRWHGWEGNFRNAPLSRGVTAVRGEYPEVFLTALDGALYHSRYVQSSSFNDWTPWERNFQAMQQQARSVSAIQSGHLEVFANTSG
jgi:hypothetical protein